MAGAGSPILMRGSDQGEGPDDDGSGDVCTIVHQDCITGCIEKEAFEGLIS